MRMLQPHISPSSHPSYKTTKNPNTVAMPNIPGSLTTPSDRNQHRLCHVKVSMHKPNATSSRSVSSSFVTCKTKLSNLIGPWNIWNNYVWERKKLPYKVFRFCRSCEVTDKWNETLQLRCMNIEKWMQLVDSKPCESCIKWINQKQGRVIDAPSSDNPTMTEDCF